ncbi:hypothetical protein BCEN4_170006 [Burkholderia cenocepacia]|nr:hypothetical protein BCEN4_170006 [Burkholderia cenocepacia]
MIVQDSVNTNEIVLLYDLKAMRHA